MISVRLMGGLRERSNRKQERFRVSYENGLTPASLAVTEGFFKSDLGAMMAAINNTVMPMDTPLKDGDAVTFMMSITGGATYIDKV